MSLRNLFTTHPDKFMAELAVERPDFLSAETAAELDENDPLGYTASLFNDTQLIPFAGHSLGPGLKKTKEKILQTIDLQGQLHAGHFPESHPDGQDSGHWFDCDRHAPSLRGAQQLLGFKEMHEFCFTASGLSQNLGTVVETFLRHKADDWSTGKTQVVLLATEFFSDQAIITSVMRRAIQTAVDYKCFTKESKPEPENELMRIEPDKDGIYSTDNIIKTIAANADKIKMICLPDIVFSTGQRLELDKVFSALADVIKQHEIKVIIDLAHTVGNRPINLESMPVTAAVGCAYKHLSGPAGSAFGIYVNRHVNLEDYPVIQGWKAADPSKVFGKINQYDESIMEHTAGATAMRTSNPPPIALLPAQTFLTVFGEIGFDKLFAKSERLTRYLLAQLQKHLGDKIDIITPLDSKQRGATICIRLKLKDKVDLRLLEDQLKAAGFEIDTRPPNLIHMTAHYGYTKFSHIHRFIQQFKHVLDNRLEAEVKESPIEDKRIPMHSFFNPDAQSGLKLHSGKIRAGSFGIQDAMEAPAAVSANSYRR